MNYLIRRYRQLSKQNRSAGLEYSKISEIKGPLLVIDGVTNAAFDELVEIQTPSNEKRGSSNIYTNYRTFFKI